MFRALVPLLAVGVLAIWFVARSRQPVMPSAAQVARERASTPPGMVYVPAGWCILGTDDPESDDDVRPARRVWVASYYIDRTEVTAREYKRFKPDYEIAPGEEDLPATNVTYAEAEAYAKSLGKVIPTEEQWEKAARSEDGRSFPWGNEWSPKRVAARRKGAPIIEKKGNVCSIFANRVEPVGRHSDGASPYGCMDMAGNAWEWVQGFYRGNPDQRILRGGAVGYGERACRSYHRAIEGAGVT
jgi:formylglycine-generating enzyme required for sulfatase activity